MGISANQARLLALTVRRSDLESQIQLILNNKLNTTKETSEISDDYSRATANRRLFIFQSVQDPSKEKMYQDLSAKNLCNTSGLMLATKSGANTYTQILTNDPKLIEKGLRANIIFLVKAADNQTQDPKTIDFATNYTNYGGTASGILSAPITNTKWEVVDWRTSTSVIDELDKSDDESAQQTYERLMREIQNKETSLDIELNNIQTAHTAIINEFDSVKKILTKNEEDSFKYFT